MLISLLFAKISYLHSFDSNTSPGCGMGIMPEERRVVCSNCQFVFCRLCSQGFHIGDCIQAGPDSLNGPAATNEG
jgi:hypothetical protein